MKTLTASETLGLLRQYVAPRDPLYRHVQGASEATQAFPGPPRLDWTTERTLERSMQRQEDFLNIVTGHERGSPYAADLLSRPQFRPQLREPHDMRTASSRSRLIVWYHERAARECRPDYFGPDERLPLERRLKGIRYEARHKNPSLRMTGEYRLSETARQLPLFPDLEPEPQDALFRILYEVDRIPTASRARSSYIVYGAIYHETSITPERNARLRFERRLERAADAKLEAWGLSRPVKRRRRHLQAALV